MQRCKEKIAKVFKVFTLKSTKATSISEKLEKKSKGRNQQITPRSRFQQLPSLRRRIDWWRL
jgi:hypothetical protein